MDLKEMTNYKWIPVYNSSDEIEEWRYTTLFTDVWNFEILMSLSDLLGELEIARKGDWLYRYKKLDEYSKILEHYGELVLDLNVVKIMWYKEHTLIDNLAKRAEIKEEDNLEIKN